VEVVEQPDGISRDGGIDTVVKIYYKQPPCSGVGTGEFYRQCKTPWQMAEIATRKIRIEKCNKVSRRMDEAVHEKSIVES